MKRMIFSVVLAAAGLFAVPGFADEVNSFRVTPYVQHPATNAISLLWLAQTNGNATVSWWKTNTPAVVSTIDTAHKIAPTDRVALSRFTALDTLQYCEAPELAYTNSVEAADNYPAYTREAKNAGWSMSYTTPWQYRVRLTGLEPDTVYGYRVTLVGGASYEKTFRTAPTTWRAIRFTLYSDSETEPADNPLSTGRTTDWTDPATTNTRTYYATQSAAYATNLSEVAAFAPDLIVMAGDLAQKGSRQVDWDEFWRHNAGLLNDPAGSIPIVASPGNHDYYSYRDGGEAAVKKYLSYFEYEPNGAAVDDDQQELFHRVDYGPVTFLFMDANNGDDDDMTKDSNRYLGRGADGYYVDNGTGGCGCRAPDFNEGSVQYQWLEAQLKDAQQKSAFTFVVCHQCPYSVGYHGRTNDDVNVQTSFGKEFLSGRALRALESLFCKYGVDAWLCGHDEIMEHSAVTGTETLPDSTTRPHTIHVYDMGIAGDGLRGWVKDYFKVNPIEQFRAFKDSAEVYDAQGVLTSGGVHYGHLQVSVDPVGDGTWKATLDPVYCCFSTNAAGNAVYLGLMHYADKVELVSDAFDDPEPTHFWHVASDGDPAASGANWANATTLTNALASVSDGDEIWLKTGTYTVTAQLSCTNAIAIRGGFAGTETAASDRAAIGTRSVAAAYSILSSAQSKSVENVLSISAASGTVVLDRLDVTLGRYRGLYKTGNASLVLLDSRFESNGKNGDGNDACREGRGAYVTATTAGTSTLVVSNCVFADNIHLNDNSYGGLAGGGCYVKSLAHATFCDTLFATNGIAFDGNAGRENASRGGAICVVGTPVLCLRTQFIGNGAVTHADKCGVGGVFLDGACGGSAFTNCTFVGNWTKIWSSKGTYTGALYLNMDSAAARVDVSRCTFAHNFSCTSAASPGWAAGLTVNCGTAVIRNAIFHNNLVNAVTKSAADVALRNSNATVDIDYALVDYTRETCWPYVFNGGGVLRLGEHLWKENPDFVTDDATVLANLSAELTPPRTTASSSFTWKTGTDVSSFDVHLRATAGRWHAATGTWICDDGNSFAIDRGDVSEGVGAETAPNGGKPNLGAYAGTAEASRSESYAPASSEVSVSGMDEDGYARPWVTVTLGGSGTYFANVWLCYGSASSSESGTNGWQNVRMIGQGVKGTTVAGGSCDYYDPGATVYYRVFLEEDGVFFAGPAAESVTVTGTRPAFDGHGGGANVIHVRSGASCRRDGSNWSDAYPSMTEALSALTPTRNVIWIMGDLQIPLTLNACETCSPVTFVGGFTETEYAEESLTSGRLSKLDGCSSAILLTLRNPANCDLQFRNILFTKSHQQALIKTGAGDMTFSNCTFYACCTLDGYLGRAVCVSDAAGATIRCTDCRFLENHTLETAMAEKDDCYTQHGATCFYVNGAKRLIVENCLLATNGLSRVQCNTYHYGRQAFRGPVAYLVGTPLTMTDTRVIDNAGTAHDISGTAGLIEFSGNCSGSAFTNCLFEGNVDSSWSVPGYSPTPSVGGVFYMNGNASDTYDFKNCTFAFNLGAGPNSPAVMNIVNGQVRIRDSIFYGNVSHGTRNCGVDLKVGSSAHVDVDYTMFGSLSSTNVSGTAYITFGDHVLTGSPCFVTTDDAFKASLTQSVGDLRTPYVSQQIYLTLSADAFFNVHLRGRHGYTDETTGALCRYPATSYNCAIDAGDPSAPCAREPEPNGRRVNLGYYGNTPWATRSNRTGAALWVK